MCELMWVYYILAWREGEIWKRKGAMYGYENDELSPATPHFLSGASFPIDTQRHNSHICLFFFLLFLCALHKLWCHLCRKKKLLETPESLLFWLLFWAEPIHLWPQPCHSLIAVRFIDGPEKLPVAGVRTLQIRISKNLRKASGMRDLYLRLQPCRIVGNVQSMVDKWIPYKCGRCVWNIMILKAETDSERDL